MPASSQTMIKNRIYLTDLEDQIREMYVAALREGLFQGIREAAWKTHNDSSNAANHWMLSVTGGSSPRNRKLGHPRDLRGGMNPPVGSQGDARGSGTSVSFGVAEQIANRELREVISKQVRGNKPPTKFALFNAVGDIDRYANRAQLEEAGNQGLSRVKESFEREFNRQQKTRRNRK